MAICGFCGGELVPFNFLQRGKGRDYSRAKLTGFVDPQGFECSNKKCGRTFGVDEEGELRLVVAVSVHHKRPWLGRVIEVVGEWLMG